MNSQQIATKIVTKLVEAGYTAYFAGGWVRDYLMKCPTNDIDIATDASPAEIIKLFARTTAVGASFGVVVVIKEGVSCEVSSFRKDGLYIDGRHPEGVEYSTPKEDALRRDFTINGMFYDPLKGEVYDYVNGQEDLKNKVIRAIGNPDHRFTEDRLRMIRAVRFSCRLGFAIDPATEKAILDHAETLFPAVSIERVWQELNKMAKCSSFEKALIELHRLKLLPVIFPVLKGVSLDELRWHVAFFAQFPENCPTILYLMELFPNVEMERHLELCRYLKTSNKDIQAVEFLEKARQLVQRDQSGRSLVEPVEWAHFYANPLSDLCLKIIAARYTPQQREAFLALHHAWQRGLQDHIYRFKSGALIVTSELLRQHGVPVGRVMGELLREAERVAVNHNLNDAEEIIRLLRQRMTWPTS